ncbi:NUDIX domain-containing protein [Candidatus Poribacteria bacterium]|nr:NUDIX domain-containing protein [Candidatus Poribacteria bacterium]
MPRAPFQVLVIPFRKNRHGNFEYTIFKRANEPYWQGIAGGGEDNESPIEAAKREAFEEANIPTSEKYFMLQTTFSVEVSYIRITARNHWPKDLYVIPNYCFAVDSSNVEIVLSHEHSEYQWVNYEEGRNRLYWENNKTALGELNERLLNDDLPSPALERVMTMSVQTVLDDPIAQYVNRVKAQRHTEESAVVQELVQGGYEQVIRKLHARYQRGELTFRTVAAELGLSVRELYDLFEQKGLST